MRKHTLVLGAIATIALTAVAVASLSGHRQAFSGSQPPTISTEDLHRQVDAGSLPVTHIDEPY